MFPGWYRGRTPHIHLKVHAGGEVVHTGQIFFDEQATAAVYGTSPYRTHGQPDTSHARDGIFRRAGAGGIAGGSRSASPPKRKPPAGAAARL